MSKLAINTNGTVNSTLNSTTGDSFYVSPYQWDKPYVDPYDIWKPITYTLSNFCSIVPTPIQVLENEDEYLLQAELPGFKDEEIDISFNNGYLSIKATKKEVKTSHKVKYLGSMSKATIEGAYALYDVDIKAAVATFENGMLSVVVPKTDAAKPRKIKITK